jgi:hypothetical protein
VDYIKPDTILEFWRTPKGGAPTLFNTYFVRKIEYVDNGQERVIATGYDPNELLKRRIVAYYASSAYSQKSDAADSIIWFLNSENLGTEATDTDRSLSPYLSGAGSPDSGPVTTMGFAWRNVLTVCQDICEASRKAGTELYFDWKPYVYTDGSIRYYFYTYLTQPGRDHTSTGDSPVLFGRDYGNLVDANLTYDYTDEINYIYAGGQGQEANREIVEVEDTTRIGISLWNRREGFADVRNATSADPTDEITARANAALEAGRPKVTFTGTLTDTYQYKLGIDWNWGDRITCSHFGRQFDGVIKEVSISVSEDGKETISVGIEVDL